MLIQTTSPGRISKGECGRRYILEPAGSLEAQAEEVKNKENSRMSGLGVGRRGKIFKKYVKE